MKPSYKAPKKKMLCCPLPTDRKMRKNRVGFFFFFFFFLCQIWAKNLLKFVFNGLKKHLHDLYMRFDCIPPEISPFKKKKSRPTDPIFKFWSGEGNITIFFFWPNKVILLVPALYISVFMPPHRRCRRHYVSGLSVRIFSFTR